MFFIATFFFPGDFGIFDACYCLRIDLLSSLGGRGNCVVCRLCAQGLERNTSFPEGLDCSTKLLHYPFPFAKGCGTSPTHTFSRGNLISWGRYMTALSIPEVL